MDDREGSAGYTRASDKDRRGYLYVYIGIIGIYVYRRYRRNTNKRISYIITSSSLLSHTEGAPRCTLDPVITIGTTTTTTTTTMMMMMFSGTKGINNNFKCVLFFYFLLFFIKE